MEIREKRSGRLNETQSKKEGKKSKEKG